MFLPQKAKERCLIGYAKMLEYLKDKNVGTLCPPLFLPAKSCVGHCESKKFDVIKGLRIWETKSLGILDAGELTGVANLCSRCKVEVRKFRKQTREDFWALLPTFYGLPPWENLKDGWTGLIGHFMAYAVFIHSNYHPSNSLWQSKPSITFCLLMSLSWLTKSPITMTCLSFIPDYLKLWGLVNHDS